MLIPVKCFTCGKVLGDLFQYYQEKVLDEKLKKLKSSSDVYDTQYFTKQNVEKSIEGHTMDSLGIKKQCCRINILSHVEIE